MPILYLPEGACGFGALFCGTGVGEDRSPVAIPNHLVGSVAIKNTLDLWGLHANAVIELHPHSDLGSVRIGRLSLSEPERRLQYD